MVVAVGEAKELVEGLEGADTLDILQPKAVCISRASGEFDRAAQTAACLIDGGGAMEREMFSLRTTVSNLVSCTPTSLSGRLP